MANKPPRIPPLIRARLDGARIARLATVDSEQKPHVIPICFVWDGSLFYSAMDHKRKSVALSQLKRLKNIQENPQVALLVDHYEEDWACLWYILVRGKAKLVTAPAERKRAIRRLRTKYPQYDMAMLADDAPVLRIAPLRIVAWGAR
jgi:PPOX class probable F420-dependent enzyme